VLLLQGTSGNAENTAIALQIGVRSNGTTKAITVLNNGRVGIGTLTPAYTLDISGIANISDPAGMADTLNFAGNWGYLKVDHSTGLMTLDAYYNLNLETYSAGKGYIRFSPSETAVMCVTTNGVGIGTTNPIAALNIQTANPTIKLGSGNDAAFITRYDLSQVLRLGSAANSGCIDIDGCIKPTGVSMPALRAIGYSAGQTAAIQTWGPSVSAVFSSISSNGWLCVGGTTNQASVQIDSYGTILARTSYWASAQSTPPANPPAGVGAIYCDGTNWWRTVGTNAWRKLPNLYEEQLNGTNGLTWTPTGSTNNYWILGGP